ncbi:Zf-HC2 domain-containing protein [Sulfidibacter corallicola]|uniref:Zf-HC2 domain-containing protein n=1 Tax=Sulfidibacter corallicola TaxID=2818388 RepID=A0A8A4TQV9_SULCO|nr:zf-HC2 domain-containing protein [Sulfidibacter corallicola]QTD51797.1 zf-HC2 domain-containing protein [Sulfidibacter corallicola]
MPPKPSINEAFRELASLDHMAPGDDHPDEEVLVDYVDGLLDESENETVAEHLSRCPSCSKTVLYLGNAAIPSSPDPASSSPAAETATVAPSVAEPLRRGKGGRPWIPVMAAAVVAGLALLAGYFYGASARPAAAYPVDLFAMETWEVRGPDSVSVATPSDKTPYLVLNLNTNPEREYDSYRASLYVEATPLGGALLEQELFYLKKDGYFSMIVPTRRLPENHYRIVITGHADRADANPVSLANFTFKVQHAP